MNRMIQYFCLLMLLFTTSKGYANLLKEVLEIKDISALCIICEKINKTPVSDPISYLVLFLRHNDRDFDDCSKALVVCKKLSNDPTLENKNEILCIKCIKCTLGHLLLVKSCIYELYKNDLNELDREFFEKLDVVSLMEKIKEIEQRNETKNKNTSSNCTIS